MEILSACICRAQCDKFNNSERIAVRTAWCRASHIARWCFFISAAPQPFGLALRRGACAILHFECGLILETQGGAALTPFVLRSLMSYSAWGHASVLYLVN